MAISLTIVAIFVPASFMPGIAGQFFKQFGITVSVQVLFSLLAARLVTPMLAAYFLSSTQGNAARPLLRAYTRLVTWSVRHYFVTVVVGLIYLPARSGAPRCCRRVSCRPGHRALAARGRVAAGLAAGRHRKGDRGYRRAAAPPSEVKACSSTAGVPAGNP